MAGRPQVSVSPGERRGRRRARGKERLDPSRRVPEGPRTRRRAPPSDLRRDRPKLWQDRAGPEVPPGGHGLFRRRHPGRARGAGPRDRGPARSGRQVRRHVLHLCPRRDHPGSRRDPGGALRRDVRLHPLCREDAAAGHLPAGQVHARVGPVQHLPLRSDRGPGRRRDDLRRQEKDLGHPVEGRGFPRPRGAPEEGRPRQGPLARGGSTVQGPARGC